MPRNLWTKADDRKLRRYYSQGMYRDEIAELIGRSECAIKTRIARIGLVKSRRWSAKDTEFAVRSRGKLTADQIAVHLGRSSRSVYQLWHRLNLCEPRRDSSLLQEFILKLHPLGWSDAEIAHAWKAMHPKEPINRRWVQQIRSDKLGLPHNAYSKHRRLRVATRTREQCKAAGVKSLAEVRRLAFNKFAARHGWPSDLRPRAVQILDLLYQHGPHTRRQIAAAIGLRWNGSRKSFKSNDPEGSYLAHLIARGLVVASKKAFTVRGQGKGRSCDVYAIAPNVRRGPICPLKRA